jgi:hypothetical protein
MGMSGAVFVMESDITWKGKATYSELTREGALPAVGLSCLVSLPGYFAQVILHFSTPVEKNIIFLPCIRSAAMRGLSALISVAR